MKEKLIALAAKLGLTKKMQDKQMTSEDWKTLSDAVKEEFGINLQQAIKDANAQKVTELEEEQKQALMAILSVSDEEKETTEEKTAAKTEDGDAKKADANEKTPQAADTKLVEEINKFKTAFAQMEQKLKKLEGSPEDKGGKKVEIKRPEKVMIAGFGHNSKHLFGIPAELYALNKPWNQVTATGKAIENWNPDDADAFKKEFNTYAVSVADRIKTLHSRGLLGSLKKGLDSIDYTEFEGTGWGEEYVVRRQDALISYLKSLPTVANIFPVRYGVQNKMEMTNSFLTDFSQAYQSGKIFKGGYKLIPELAEVDDAMFKHMFENLKKLEKEYVGYLNREGSDPIKWNFIEWLLVETLKKLHNEQEARRVAGVRVEPVTGEAGHFMFASTGVLHRLQKYVDELKLWPFEDLNLYTKTTILDYVETFVEKVNQILPNLRGWRLSMNEKHIPWYLAAYREKYGTDLDFKGGELIVRNFELDGITAVPNMGKSCRMWITVPGNIELYEDLPGEMEKLYFQRDLESLIVASWWKEGSGAYMTGQKFATKALLEADKRKHQFIFLNDPVTELAADATTADAAVNTLFKTQNNTAAKNLTDFTNASEGEVYRITCGGTTNATTVNKTGKFDQLPSNWVPTAVGDYLEVYYDATAGKFHEVSRKVS